MSMPQPEIGKHYTLMHKETINNPFRGYVQIIQKGNIGSRLIFRTSMNSNMWYYWDEYDSEYIGDLA